MTFDSIRIVLVATSHPGNIGSTARAMKVMGFHRLYLVSPKTFPDPRAHEMSAGAYDVLLEQVVVTDSLSEALSGCQLVLGTSARARDIAVSGLTPSECATLVANTPDQTEIAIVFGREHAGLTNDELLLCHYHIHIPSNPDFSSLNLSQAVQIIVYELRMKLLSCIAAVETRPDCLATVDEVEQFHAHLQTVLIDIDFLKPSNPKRLLQRLRRLFNRIQLEQMEVNILRGILSNVQAALTKREGGS
jgi:tRNA (cytidine32/uridine32-2'-O)-methyltransferase